MLRFPFGFILVLSLALSARSAEPAPPAAIAWPVIGKLSPRPASAISGSNWSVGGEVLDRDLAVYDYYKSYLGPLGAKHIRLQAGWAKTEKKPGVYDWSWLEAVIDDALAQKVQPWLQLSYGNPAYPGGGGRTLGDGLPRSPEALAAWDQWVRLTVRRLKDRVHEWEVWNEPDGAKDVPAEEYAELFLRSAAIIREEQPKAQIYALSLSNNVKYAERVLRVVRERGQLGLINAITFHGYPMNPDETRLEGLRKMLEENGLNFPIRQGETGVPSTTGSSGALGKFPGSELTQAKWLLRRMLAFHGHDTPFNLFLLMEFDYSGMPHTGMNTKGLLKANPDKTVAYAKPAYYAAQHVFSLFDDTLKRVGEFALQGATDGPVAAYAYRQTGTDREAVVLWQSGHVPTESLTPTPMDLGFAGVKLSEPVLTDLRTGLVYSIPANLISRDKSGLPRIAAVPIYDSPVMISDRSLVLP